MTTSKNFKMLSILCTSLMIVGLVSIPFDLFFAAVATTIDNPGDFGVHRFLTFAGYGLALFLAAAAVRILIAIEANTRRDSIVDARRE
jgi:hypothetical protein